MVSFGLLEDEVHAERSHRQQDFFNKEANNKTAKYIQQIWLPILKNDLSKLISEDFEVFIDKLDPQTICFRYPRLYQDSSILQILRLEIGVLAEPVPFQIKSLKSYISNSYPDVFNNEVIIVKTMDVKRTFFEKLTILHRESMRTNNNYPLRYSRHYYDIYQMIQKGIADEALEEFKLLKMVVDFKKKFYPCKWANYDDVLQEKCQLVPNSDAIEFFSHDYDKMRSMLYGSYPTFNEIIYVLEQYEKKINLRLKIDYNISKIKS
ncbi:MAG: nucleotidyl transferase AbiEii/AbiGii toxin family protein [Erysipelotrichaceae bacterium]